MTGFYAPLALVKQHPQTFSISVVRAPSSVAEGSISCLKFSVLVYRAESQLCWQGRQRRRQCQDELQKWLPRKVSCKGMSLMVVAEG